MRQVFHYSLILIVMIALISGCKKTQEPLPILHVGHAPHDHHSPLYVAAMKPDYFKNNGGIYLREVEFKKAYELVSNTHVLAQVLIDSSTGGKKLVRKLAEGHFEMSFGGVPAFLKFIDEGHDISIVSPIMAEGAGFVVLKDQPFNNWEEFIVHVKSSRKSFRVGYKIAVSVQNLIFEAALREEGITYSTDIENKDAHVTLVNLHGAKNLIPAMQEGMIEGFVIMQPFLALAESKGVGKTVAMLNNLPPNGKWEGHPCCALAASNKFTAEHAEVSEAFVTLIMRANDYIVEQPGESANLIAKWLGLPPEVEQKSIPTIKFTNKYESTWEVGVDFWIKSMIDSGMLTGAIKNTYVKGEHKELIYDNELHKKAKGNLLP